MENKICTSIEQSQKLIELGIDVNTADMYWSLVNKNHPPIIGKYCAEYGGMQLPAWSLTVLLELTPNDVSLLHFEDAYQAVYDVRPYYITNKSDNPLDAVFEMVCWLKENNKI